MSFVLFICKYNNGRSQIAEAFFNNLTKKHKAISVAEIFMKRSRVNFRVR